VETDSFIHKKGRIPPKGNPPLSLFFFPDGVENFFMTHSSLGDRTTHGRSGITATMMCQGRLYAEELGMQLRSLHLFLMDYGTTWHRLHFDCDTPLLNPESCFFYLTSV
jgi:hypothetical protein